MRQSLLHGGPPAFQLAGGSVHCNVHMSPILLALLRGASSSQDLIHVALQFREAAEPFRKHLALLDRYSGEDLLRLADWHHDLQSICAAVARALGLDRPGSAGDIGTAVLQCLGGNPVELINCLAERAPPRLRRHLLHPMYLGRRRTFLRNLVYDSVLAPEAERALTRLFGG
jgi:hypothetical protein